MEHLIEGLVMSGLGMQSYQSSRTASGAEHQFSHLWEMEGLGHGEATKGPPLSHGFKVGVGSVAIAALYERILERDLGNLDVTRSAEPGPAGTKWSIPFGRRTQARIWRRVPSNRAWPNTSAPKCSRNGCGYSGMSGRICGRAWPTS
jgi:hypothetical protein